MDGILNLNKPSKLTSHDVVLKARKILREKRIGHTGTLDPMATGVLVLCVGRAVKLVQFLQDQSKEYMAEMTLGVRTDTLDSTGKVISSHKCSVVKGDVIKALEKFKGTISQLPPMVSAVKREGKPLYEFARQGKEVYRPERKVEIYRLELTSFREGEFPQADILVECSKGTYIRSLVDDVGISLGCGAHVSKLVRTKVGRLSLKNSVTLEKLEALAREEKVAEALITMEEAVDFFPFIQIKASGEGKVKNGQPVVLSLVKDRSSTFKKGQKLRIIDSNAKLLAIGKAEGDIKNKEAGRERILARPIKVISN